jgi:monooxygenase
MPSASSSPSDAEHHDIIVVGAGISGICAAYHLRTKFPEKSVIVLEGRPSIGG